MCVSRHSPLRKLVKCRQKLSTHIHNYRNYCDPFFFLVLLTIDPFGSFDQQHLRSRAPQSTFWYYCSPTLWLFRHIIGWKISRRTEIQPSFSSSPKRIGSHVYKVQGGVRMPLLTFFPTFQIQAWSLRVALTNSIAMVSSSVLYALIFAMGEFCSIIPSLSIQCNSVSSLRRFSSSDRLNPCRIGPH